MYLIVLQTSVDEFPPRMKYAGAMIFVVDKRYSASVKLIAFSRTSRVRKLTHITPFGAPSNHSMRPM